MKRVVGAAMIAVMGLTALTACGEYSPQPSYVCPAYGTPGHPGYHPASTPRAVTPTKKSTVVTPPKKPAAPKAPSLRKK